MQLISESSPTAVFAFEGYAGVAEVYLRLWEVSIVSNQLPAEQKLLAESAG